MTDGRREEIWDDIDILKNIQTELGEWFDAEHEEWVQDKDNPDRERPEPRSSDRPFQTGRGVPRESDRAPAGHDVRRPENGR